MNGRVPILLPIVAILMACASPAAESPPGRARPPSPRNERRILGESRQGRSIEGVVIGDGERVVLFLATIHGDEAAGTPLLRELAAHLLEHPAKVAGRTVVIVPVANPDGAGNGTRGNAAGVDLNRNYPTANFRPTRRNGPRPLSEPESCALHSLIEEFDPAVVVSIHQPLSCVDFDGPGRDLAVAMAAACRLPVRKLGARSGSLGSWVGETLGTPIVTLEMPREVPAAAAWDRYGGALLEAIR